MSPISDEKFSAAAEKLPSTPRIFGKINVALRNPDVEVEEIARILKLDAALSARLLRVGNSAASASGVPASDLSEAIQRVGFREVFRVVGAAMTGQLYVSGLPLYGVSGTELWENSVATAIAMEKLAAEAGVDTRAAYTLGLLRSVGRLLLERLSAGNFAPLSGRKSTGAQVLAWEAESFGFDSGAAARRLFALWKFAPELAAPLESHFSPLSAPADRVAALLHVAGWIAESLGFGLAIEKDVWSVAPEILAQAGVAQELVDRVAEETKSDLSRLSKLVG